MLWAYLFLAFGLYGLYDVFSQRYFLLTDNAHDAGIFPRSREVAQAMKEAVFDNGGEVKREAPLSLYIAFAVAYFISKYKSRNVVEFFVYIVIGSVGVILFVYNLLDTFLSISKISE